MKWLLFFFLVACTSRPAVVPVEKLEGSGDSPPEWTVGKVYRDHYHFSNATDKLVDNQGVGKESLYGTRNFRAVLNGVYYRGGANNKFRREGKRDNSNPLPPEGLESLCREGFSDAVYLYEKNFSSAAMEVNCRTFTGKENTLKYSQVSPLKRNRADMEKLLRLIYQHVKQPSLGPIYDHCWNGWHASGVVAAAALQQFCGFSPAQAEAYWITNTDGDSNYTSVKKMVRDFQPLPDVQLNALEKRQLCPEPETLVFRD